MLGFKLLPTILGKLVFMKFSGMGDGFGCTQSRKSTLVKDIVGYVHETSREQPSLVELPDQSHSGVIDVDNQIWYLRIWWRIFRVVHILG